MRKLKYSFGHSILGSVWGGIIGALIGIVKLFLPRVFELSPEEIIYTLESELTLELLLSPDVFTPLIVCIVIGFLWNGFEGLREIFSFSYAICGTICGGIAGLYLNGIIAGGIKLVSLIAKTNPDIGIFRYLIVATIIFMALGTAWNGFELTRDGFSVHSSALGILTGIICGIFVSCSIIFSSVGFFVGSLLLFPVTLSVTAIITLFYSVKGFWVMGTGGGFDDVV